MQSALLQGLASVTFGLICVSARLCLTVFITQRRKSGLRAATAKEPARQPRLVHCCSALCLNLECLYICHVSGCMLHAGTVQLPSSACAASRQLWLRPPSAGPIAPQGSAEGVRR